MNKYDEAMKQLNGNLGWVCDEKSAEMMTKLRTVFAGWYYEANNDEDPNTCLLSMLLLPEARLSEITLAGLFRSCSSR